MNENNETKQNIVIELRSVEIPVSEYERLIKAGAMLEILATAAESFNYDSDFRKMCKLLLSNIKGCGCQCKCKEDPDE